MGGYCLTKVKSKEKYGDFSKPKENIVSETPVKQNENIVSENISNSLKVPPDSQQNTILNREDSNKCRRNEKECSIFFNKLIYIILSIFFQFSRLI